MTRISTIKEFEELSDIHDSAEKHDLAEEPKHVTEVKSLAASPIVIVKSWGGVLQYMT